MADDRRNKPSTRLSVDTVLWSITSLNDKDVTEEEVAYFRSHPDQIEEVSSPLVLHKVILWGGLAIGVLLVAVSKFLAHGLEFLHTVIGEFIVDIVFEMGVALIGAAIVTFLISITLNEQQASAKKWRKEIRRRVAQDE